MRNLALFSIALAATVTFFTPAFGLSREDQVELVKGLQAVCVVVERLRPEIERDGLFAGTLREDVEMKLRLAGIQVLSEEDSLDDVPQIYLHVDAFKYRKGYVYRIQLCLRESVTLLRKPGRVRAATLRIPDELGVTRSLPAIRETAEDMVDDFIKIWVSANPK